MLILLSAAHTSLATEMLSWSPEQATGKPDTFESGDFKTAWATLEEDKGEEWIKLEYERAVDVVAVRIRETFNPGAVIKVTVFDEKGVEQTIWEGTAVTAAAPHVFEVKAAQVVKSKSVKIYMNTKRVEGWNEIDAVQLVGRDGSEQWAVAASASSTYASTISDRRNEPPTYENLPPSVVRTVPESGDLSVSSSLNEIRVTFSKDMLTDRMWAFCRISADSFPGTPEGREIHYLPDNRTCVMPVALQPDKTYVIWINSGSFNSFRDTKNNPAVPYLLVFKTKSE